MLELGILPQIPNPCPCPSFTVSGPLPFGTSMVSLIAGVPDAFTFVYKSENSLGNYVHFTDEEDILVLRTGSKAGGCKKFCLG